MLQYYGCKENCNYCIKHCEICKIVVEYHKRSRLIGGRFVKLSDLRQLTKNVPDLQGAMLQQWLQEQLSSMGMDPSMIYQELEMTSRFVDTHRDISYPNAHMQLHSHAFYELLFCCNSCNAEYLVGSQRYRLREGDLILCRRVSVTVRCCRRICQNPMSVMFCG